MLGTGQLDERTGKEPLLADETRPLTFLPSANDDRPRSKKVGGALAIVMITFLAGAVLLATNGRNPQWHPLLEPYVEFVESERGLEFSSPVGVSDTNVADYIPENVRRRTATHRLPELNTAFLLLGVEDLDPAETSVNGPVDQIFYFRTEEAIGDSHYIIESSQILLRLDLPEEALQLNIVHELTRALQHQNGLVPSDFGDISAFGPLDESDGQRLFDALVEGDATRIERAYYEQMTEAERAAYHEAAGIELEGVRNPAVESDRYTIGSAFTSWIVQRDGVEALNEMLRMGEHGSTDRFVDVLGDFAQTVDAVAEADLPTTDREPLNGFGAFGWFLALAPHVGTADAFDAVIGYGGDAFVITDNPAVQRTSPLRTCMHSEVFFDSTSDAAEFATIVDQLDVQVETSVRSDTMSVRVDLCERLSSQREQTPATVVPLIVANELAAHHLANGVPIDVARCASIAQAKTVPHDTDLTTLTSYGPYFENSQAFIDSCL